ncbi:uncharacterized protein LOC143225321 [Tachypleus tridentatus]|uniref:uncharacterized protein LOC143225321 n=1 Tax=Tachypleus tridentatus TaxID=6853 RepID=UPI003FD61769
MKVLLVTLVVLVSLSMAKGNTIDVGLQLMCKTNKEKHEKMKEIRKCERKVVGKKAPELPDAVKTCKKNVVSEDKLDEFWNEICDEGQEANMQQFKNCIADKVEEAGEDSESLLIAIIKNCI